MSFSIDDKDRELINELRSKLQQELKLVPEYDDDISLQRWLIGHDRNVDEIVPKLKYSLRTIHAFGIHKMDLSSLDRVNEECYAVSEALQYLPGTLVGFDKDGNALSIQMVGHIDTAGILKSASLSKLLIRKIIESEGVQCVLRAREKEEGRPLGVSVICDLEGLSFFPDKHIVATFSIMTALLQDMFPDILRKFIIINAPTVMTMIWNLVTPCLAKATTEKIEVLDKHWRDNLKLRVGEEVLFEHWGGTRQHESPFGFVGKGGKVPQSLRYDKTNDLPISMLTSLKIGAGCVSFVPITLKGPTKGKRRLHWYWKLDSGDVSFSVLKAAEGNEDIAEDETDSILRPKFRLHTPYVPETGDVDATEPGVYKLVFDNSYASFWSKYIKYSYEIRNEE